MHTLYDLVFLSADLPVYDEALGLVYSLPVDDLPFNLRVSSGFDRETGPEVTVETDIDGSAWEIEQRLADLPEEDEWGRPLLVLESPDDIAYRLAEQAAEKGS